MKITPLDIQQQQFKGKMIGGLDPEDVDGFLQMVAQEMEGLVRENTELREQCRKAAADVEQMARQEKDLREAMLAAQKITEEMKANAQKEASLLVSEAELKAEKILADAERRLAQMGDQIQELRRQKVQFESAFKSLLDTHYKMLSLDEA
ncbi:DivIVA domain-containing protein [Geobacter sp.]|uniref:DivIVA domain-containing protein n=1 Tax=Geobacter sp. TaxID=46610 RepID=UPI00261D29D1|nr:DivIVA domain-containing protein [Geobacter sp.]